MNKEQLPVEEVSSTYQLVAENCGLRKGYKQTEVGVIPEDWTDIKLGCFVSLQRGHDLTVRERRQGNVPVMGSAGQNGFYDTALVNALGLVIGRSGASFGQAHYCDQDFWPHNTALYVTDFHENDPLFSFYFLKALDFTRHNSGGAQQSLNRNFIYPIPVAIPPLPEQRVIATALSDVDALLAKLDQLITKKRDLKQAAMQQLLTGQTRLSGLSSNTKYKKTEVGLIPEDWEVWTMRASLHRGRLGGNYPNQEIESSKPLIKMGNIARGSIDLSKVEYIPENIKIEREHRLKSGDILFNTRNTLDLVGKVSIWRDELPEAYYNPT